MNPGGFPKCARRISPTVFWQVGFLAQGAKQGLGISKITDNGNRRLVIGESGSLLDLNTIFTQPNGIWSFPAFQGYQLGGDLQPHLYRQVLKIGSDYSARKPFIPGCSIDGIEKLVSQIVTMAGHRATDRAAGS